jgi:hypothetical protein
MAKQKEEFKKMIVTHKCLIKQFGQSGVTEAKVGDIVNVPIADVNYLAAIKRATVYDGDQEAGETAAPEKKSKRSKE